MFRLTREPLDPAALRQTLLDPGAGACATFEGLVRDQNEGRRVLALEYEAYGELAEKEGARILAEAQAKFALLDVACAHRTGWLGLGELAVWVGVTAAHRDAAFTACRYIIDECKVRVPVWKKEHYSDGASEWLNCAARGDHTGLAKDG
ncbi:MAG: molybdenum cofactor biosynthesis protein MoaE [Terriglobales bacterium]